MENKQVTQSGVFLSPPYIDCLDVVWYFLICFLKGFSSK